MNHGDKLAHALIAITCVVIGHFVGYLEAGLVASVAFHYGREEAQQERRNIYDPVRGGNPSKKWQAIFFINWQQDAVWDFLVPLGVAVLAYILFTGVI